MEDGPFFFNLDYFIISSTPSIFDFSSVARRSTSFFCRCFTLVLVLDLVMEYETRFPPKLSRWCDV